MKLLTVQISYMLQISMGYNLWYWNITLEEDKWDHRGGRVVPLIARGLLVWRREYWRDRSHRTMEGGKVY